MSFKTVNVRVKTAICALGVCFVGTACTSVLYTDATGSSNQPNAAVLWHPGLSIERVDQLAVTSPALGGSDRSRIGPGLRRVYCVRSNYQPYEGTIITYFHGQANFQPGKTYYAHQNLVRGRLEIVELPDDFTLPQSKAFVHDSAYEQAIRRAEQVHRASIIPNLYLPTNEIK
jgi:hypothetical protein